MVGAMPLLLFSCAMAGAVVVVLVDGDELGWAGNHGRSIGDYGGRWMNDDQSVSPFDPSVNNSPPLFVVDEEEVTESAEKTKDAPNDASGEVGQTIALV